jgi:hypothetical protein
MYFPLLRGKQNELLALRELLKEGKLSKKIIPIIEPIKASPSFRILLQDFSRENRNLAVIQNSKLARYLGFKDNNEINEIKSSKEFIPAYLLYKDNDCGIINQRLKNKYHMIILDEKSEINIKKIITSDTLLIIDTNNREMMHDAKKENFSRIIELHDVYDKKDRNQDYAEDQDQLFSVEHLLYKEDGLYGFSDYSVIGSNYDEAGFAPKAVAIHIVYFDSDNKLRIRHFVSDSNEDIHNPANKFKEALKKLIDWYDSDLFDKAKNDSSALNEFKNLFLAGAYPGLGIIKRLAIKHHLEILGKFLDSEN